MLATLPATLCRLVAAGRLASVTLFALVIAPAMTAPPPAADDVVATHAAVVSAAGFDLAAPDGRAALDRRILLAARRACRGDAPEQQTAAGPGFEDCVSEAVAGTAAWSAARAAHAGTVRLASELPVR